MNEQLKYDVIKKLVDSEGNKDRAALTLGISKRQVNRLIVAYKEKGKAAFIHGINLFYYFFIILLIFQKCLTHKLKFYVFIFF